MLQLLSVSYGCFCPFYKTDNDKRKKSEESTQCQVKWGIYTAQSTQLGDALAGCLYLINQVNLPVRKGELIIVYLHLWLQFIFIFLSTCQVREKGDVQSYAVEERFYSISKKWQISLFSQTSHLETCLKCILGLQSVALWKLQVTASPKRGMA